MAADEITFTSTAPRLTITALLDGEGAVVTGGYAEWEVIPRPRRLAVTHYVGRSPYTMDLAIILDGHQSYESVETKCTNLEHLAFPDDTTKVPPIVSLKKEGEKHPAIPHSDINEWVVQNLTWGEVIRNSSGLRTRQHVVVSLLRYVAVDKIQIISAAEAARNKAGAGVRTVAVKQGDTLGKIAARYLGKSSRWPEIKKLNPNIRDPANLKGIKTVKIPPK